MTLGQGISDVSTELVDLMLRMPDPVAKKALRKELVQILELTADLVDGRVMTRTGQYRVARSALAEASAAVQAAKEDVDMLVGAVARVANAIHLVTPVARAASRAGRKDETD